MKSKKDTHSPSKYFQDKITDKIKQNKIKKSNKIKK